MDGTDKEESALGKEAILRTTMGDIHIRGMGICSSIEGVKCDKSDKPLNDISIISIDIL